MNGVTSACFKHDGKIGFYGIVITLANEAWKYIWVFLYKLSGISEHWDVLFSFSSLISVSISLKLTSLKLKSTFLLHLVLIASMLGCFSYLRIAFKVESLTFSIIGSKLEYWEMLRLFTILPKNC